MRGNDRRLLRRIKAGESEACAQFVRLYYRRIYAFLAAMTGSQSVAEDLTQDTFAAAWGEIGDFRGRSSLSTWLHRIAYNKCVDLKRRDSRLDSALCERVLREYKFELPSTAIRRFVVTREVVESPDAELRKIVEEPEYEAARFFEEMAERFAEEFRTTHGIVIRFDAEALKHLVEMALRGGRTVLDLCRELFKDYEYGLNLIRQNTGRQKFVITAECVQQPQETLNRWVERSYKK